MLDGRPPVDAAVRELENELLTALELKPELLELYVGSNTDDGMPPVEATTAGLLDETASLELVDLWVGSTTEDGMPPVEATV